STGSLAYSTFLGGGTDDEGMAVAVDASQNAYVTGFASSTGSAPFPVTGNPFQQALTGATAHAFIARFDTTQSGVASLIYSRLLGGNNAQAFGDVAYGIAVDSSHNVYVTGETTSTDFPLTTTLPQSAINPNGSIFAAKLNPAASGSGGLLYSTFLA